MGLFMKDYCAFHLLIGIIWIIWMDYMIIFYAAEFGGIWSTPKRNPLAMSNYHGCTFEPPSINVLVNDKDIIMCGPLLCGGIMAKLMILGTVTKRSHY